MTITDMNIWRLPNGQATGYIKIVSSLGFETKMYLDTLTADGICDLARPIVEKLAYETAVCLEPVA